MFHGGGDRGRSTFGTFVTLLGVLILLGSIVSMYHGTGLTGSKPKPLLIFAAAIVFILGMYLFGWGVGQLYAPHTSVR